MVMPRSGISSPDEFFVIIWQHIYAGMCNMCIVYYETNS